MHILLNAGNLGATGPRIVLQNVVPLMGALAPGDLFTLLLPSTESTENWNLPGNVVVRRVRRTRPRELGRAWDIQFGVTRLCRDLAADVCFTLGDIGPIDPGVPHVVFLHQAYIVYHEPYLSDALPAWERLKLWYLRRHFAHSAQRATAVVVQTGIMADRVIRAFGIPSQKVHVVPSALPEHVRAVEPSAIEPDARLLAVPTSTRLLFLATYYAHKNHAVLLPLISELRRRGLAEKVHIFLTLDGNRRPAEGALLRSLEPHRDVVTNLGRLPSNSVASALVAADALFLPTLVETFGLIYLEAMACGTQILTSDLDFARWMCHDLALFFDPTDPASIADAIQRLVLDEGVPNYKARARKRLAEFPETWDPVARAYLDILADCLT